MMRIGILGHGFMNWGGGIDFLRAVAQSLIQADDAIELHLLLPTSGPRLAARNALRSTYRGARILLGRKVATPPPRMDCSHIAELASGVGPRLALHAIDSGATAIASAGLKLSLDVVMPAITTLPSDFPIPWVGYVFDLQHRYIPEYFSLKERVQRDRQFTTMLSNARTVIVNSRSVAADIAQFHQGARARVFALPFSAAPQAAWLQPAESPAARYGIQSRYFIVCNQFWKHKDHATAMAAFSQIARTYPNVDLVCTGSTDDYRDPDHFPSLQRDAARDGISHRVHILGMVPKADQIALMKDALALVQPTLFEGGPGGGAVYDAVSLGVPSLVSDIPVNREIDEPTVRFFRARDPEDLATAMERCLAGDLPARPTQADLLALGRIRRAACGRVLMLAAEMSLRP